MPSPSVNIDALSRLCDDLRLLREQSGGPSVRALANRVGLGKSQVAAIFAGRISRPPQWPVLRELVAGCYRYAREHDRLHALSITGGLDEYWRRRHALVEHAALTRSAPGFPALPSASTIPRELPPAVPHFVGREAELAALTRAAALTDDGCGPLLITGTAGVGKTALALAWAHRMAAEFPDGQLFVCLRGFDPGRRAMTPTEAVRILLAGLDLPTAALPVGLDARLGRYRSLLAGRRVLVVLDDARDAEQVRPLLPGSSTARVVVTSRAELTGLVAIDGGHPLALTALPERDAYRLLARRLGAPRVDAEPAAAHRLVEVSGRLPIALTALAARAATRPGFPLAAIVEDADRVLRAGAGAAPVGSAGGGVWAVFDGSYHALSDPAARLFRLLGVHPGPDLDGDAAAGLAAAGARETGAWLAELAEANMVTEPEPGRYGLHDLWRAYTRDLAGAMSASESAAARRRCLDHYLHTAVRAALLVNPARTPIGLDQPVDGVVVTPLTDREHALAWFAAEREVLLAVIGSAVGVADAHAWRLAWAVADFLEMRGYHDDWRAAQRDAVRAARRLDEPVTLARMLVILGNAELRAQRPEHASEPLQEALELFRTSGEAAWQARTEHTIGHLWERQGRHAEALGCARRALLLYRAAGDPEGIARAHNALGWCQARLGRYHLAVRQCEQALTAYRAIGDRNGLAATLDSLGYAHLGMGSHEPAVRCYHEALDLVRELGDRVNEAVTWTHLGDAHDAAGATAAAREAWRHALTIQDELGLADAADVRARLARC